MADEDHDHEMAPTHFQFEDEHGEQHNVLRAHSFVVADCGDPECGLYHFIAFNGDGDPVAEMSITHEQMLGVIQAKHEVVGHG